ncbi:MAG: hypothetical protein JWM10_4005 [Myxococcaceae bacterium]|nr:hypothetical protein [Myxococcaceae bacterium]
MMRRLLPLCLLALSACSGATPLELPDAASPDVVTPQVTVTAAIASAALANDCPASSGAAQRDCAARPASSDAGAGLVEPCGGYCRQTSLQITFTVAAAGAADPVLPVIITGIRLIDSATNANLDTLTAREPQRWQESQYITWDGSLRGLGETRASYKLSAPNWNAIGAGNTWNTYGRAFRLEVTVLVNGQTLVLRSGELMRAPEVVT